MLPLLALLATAHALDNGLGLLPPLGWRSYNAFGGRPTQAIMEAMMSAMVDRSRTVEGQPTSLLDLGYDRVGLDGGWNYCFPENHTFHWASDGRPVWNNAFHDPKGMVDKAHELGLFPGWSEPHTHPVPFSCVTRLICQVPQQLWMRREPLRARYDGSCDAWIGPNAS